MGQVITQHKGGMLFESEMGQHKLIIEGPESWGGKNRGPMPPQIFTDLKVIVDYDNADHPARFYNINVTINLPNAECDDDCTRKALAKIAEHCPVHETITTLDKINFNIITG